MGHGRKVVPCTSTSSVRFGSRNAKSNTEDKHRNSSLVRLWQERAETLLDMRSSRAGWRAVYHVTLMTLAGPEVSD